MPGKLPQPALCRLFSFLSLLFARGPASRLASRPQAPDGGPCRGEPQPLALAHAAAMRPAIRDRAPPRVATVPPHCGRPVLAPAQASGRLLLVRLCRCACRIARPCRVGTLQPHTVAQACLQAFPRFLPDFSVGSTPSLFQAFPLNVHWADARQIHTQNLLDTHLTHTLCKR